MKRKNSKEMDIMEIPNKETAYFAQYIDPWLCKERWNDKKNRMEVTFKKNTPIDVLNKYLICRPKLPINYAEHYHIEKGDK